MPHSECIWDLREAGLVDFLSQIARSRRTVYEGDWGHATTLIKGDSGRQFGVNVRFQDGTSIVVSFNQQGDSLEYVAEISRGLQVFTGPTGVIDVGAGIGAATGDIDAALADIKKFLKRKSAIIKRTI